MKLKTINYFIKSYFYFSPNEVKGIRVFTILIIVTIIIPRIVAYYFPNNESDLRIISLSDKYLNDHPFKEKNFKSNHVRIDSPSIKHKPNYPVELNVADSITIVSLYRIGPSLTHRIIKYRDKLGGFISLDQLTEIWGFDEDILYDLNGKIKVDPKKAKLFNLNEVKLEALRTHPYFKYKLSNAIINYRLAHGDFQQLSDLRKIELINDSIYQQITKYLFL